MMKFLMMVWGIRQSMHITTHCNEYILPYVIVDNGSTSNVMLKMTLNSLLTDKIHLRPFHSTVRTFDGTKKGSCRENLYPTPDWTRYVQCIC
ncbi:hypothetical protein GQ457_16G015790 [Hibiscus cannabinus]